MFWANSVLCLSVMPDKSPIRETTIDAPVTGEDFESAVADVIKVIRPAIQADQGDIFLREVNEETGEVLVELVGACITCPASSQTLKDGLERILSDRVPGVTSVRHIGEELLGDTGTPVSL